MGFWVGFLVGGLLASLVWWRIWMREHVVTMKWVALAKRHSDQANDLTKQLIELQERLEEDE